MRKTTNSSIHHAGLPFHLSLPRLTARQPPCMSGPKETEVDSGKRAGLPSDVADKMKALERENR
jgi:hypothetical protein